MNKTCCYTVLAAGLAAVLPQWANAAQLTYSEAYAEWLKGGQEIGTELLVIKGHFDFDGQMSFADVSAATAWSAALQGKTLVSGSLGDGAKQNFGVKSGKSVIVLPGGTLKFTWNTEGIDFVLRWKGEPALASQYKDQTTTISAARIPVDISIGGLKGYFDVAATGKAKAKTKKGVTLSNIALKGSATSAGLNALDRDGDSYHADVDCNDFAPTVHPGATEATLDGVDSNCDGRDSGVAEMVETFALKGTGRSSPVINFTNVSQPGPGTPQYGPLRDFSGYNKSFSAPVGKTSFYDPTTGIKWNDDTITPVSDGQDIWRGWTHTGKWSYFNGAAGDKITLSVQRDASEASLRGAHPGFILFWRPEGGPLTWAGTQDIAEGQTMPANSDIVPAHTLIQHADWTIQGLPAKADHTAPAGVDAELYPMKTDSYTMYYVDSGYDADKYEASKKLIMHPTAFKGMVLNDGTAGAFSKSITLPKTGYYMLYVANVLEVDDWGIGADGKLTTSGDVWELPAKGAWINITISKP
ncbi:copper(I)-binding protein CorA [Methylococcus mesophilus]|uniref:copper(I)-binding protein CorA n=1 Tax=Methylococcus mesophilus TaxID=2993564 RepID=UPI00224AB755|nr:MopE-related protein [Methylococcus mesophilus]UZR28181.1 MopE-related protein [Methylococcus mesophilus]